MDNAKMSSSVQDPKWPRLLSLSVHEFRTPLTVTAGYIRMLLKERAGAVTDQQRKLLEEAEKSCTRLTGLLAEMSDLANLEAQTAAFNRSQVQLERVLTASVEALPPLPDRDATVSLTVRDPSATLEGDAGRLTLALTSVLAALRRELVTGNELQVRQRAGESEGRLVSWIAIGDPGQSAALETADPTALSVFDEWRGGCGLSLAVARRVISAHGGSIWSPADGAKAGALLRLPRE